MGVIPSIVVDCDGVTTASEFWQRYLDAVQPAEDGFGRNLDAFWDAIEGGGPGYPGPCKLFFRGTGGLAHLRLPGGGSFLAALREMANDATKVEVIVC
jgi:ribonuclease inhibitor